MYGAVIRAEVLSLKTRGYVERSRALGAEDRVLVIEHILLTWRPGLREHEFLIVAVVVLSESALYFASVNPLHASWGKLLEDAFGGGATYGFGGGVIPPPLHGPGGALVHDDRLRPRHPQPETEVSMSILKSSATCASPRTQGGPMPRCAA